MLAQQPSALVVWAERISEDPQALEVLRGLFLGASEGYPGGNYEEFFRLLRTRVSLVEPH